MFKSFCVDKVRVLFRLCLVRFLSVSLVSSIYTCSNEIICPPSQNRFTRVTIGTPMSTKHSNRVSVRERSPGEGTVGDLRERVSTGGKTISGKGRVGVNHDT